jgi:hypothetical protein
VGVSRAVVKNEERKKQTKMTKKLEKSQTNPLTRGSFRLAAVYHIPKNDVMCDNFLSF